MKLPVPSEGSFERCPAGNHLAVCFEVVDLGTQEYKFNDEEGKRHQIWIGWETPNELDEEGRPFTIGQRYTLSSHERSNLRKDLESWRGKAFSEEDFGTFDICDIIGKGCFLNVVHVERKGKTYANPDTVAALPKGTQTPALVNEPHKLDLDPESFDSEQFDALPDWLKETVKKSPEYKFIAENGAPF